MQHKEFNLSIEQYLSKLIDFIQVRLASPEWEDCVEVIISTKNEKKYVQAVNVKIKDRRFKHYEDSDYTIKIVENPIVKTKNTITVNKYSYEIKSVTNPDDFVRFDYYPYSDFPHFHINADEKTWGNHLTYPDKTNINLEMLDCFIALEIFNAFVAHPEEHILDMDNNQRYIQKLKKS